jgi:hypothetical protein
VPYPSLPMVKRRSFAIWSSEFHCEITILGSDSLGMVCSSVLFQNRFA